MTGPVQALLAVGDEIAGPRRAPLGAGTARRRAHTALALVGLCGIRVVAVRPRRAARAIAIVVVVGTTHGRDPDVGPHRRPGLEASAVEDARHLALAPTPAHRDWEHDVEREQAHP